MPKTRYIIEFKDGVEVNRIPYEVSDEELAEEAERKVIERAEEMIDAISNLSEAKIFLKKLCLRLFKNGALP